MLKAAFPLFVVLLFASFAFSGNITTEGGNISNVGLSVPSAASTWHAAYGNVSPEAAYTVNINATSGNMTHVTITTGSGSCAAGADALAIMFSNSSANITSLSPGNLSLLDSFINSPNQNATVTFTTASSFATASYGTINGVPTTYTQPAGSQNFRMGYMQDQNGNLVFITVPVNAQAGFDGSLQDYQIMLPTENGNAVLYYAKADLSCKPVTPPTPGGGGGSGGTIQLPPLTPRPKPPEVILPEVAPSALDMKVLRFTPYREVYPGESIIVNPLIENPTPNMARFRIGFVGAGQSLATPVSNVVIPAGEKSSIPFEVRIPPNLEPGFYSFVVQLSTNESEVSYPSILRVIAPYKIGQPTVRRQFSLDYERRETQVTLMVANPSNTSVGRLQVYESIPASLASKGGQLKFVSDLTNTEGTAFGFAEGRNLRWDVQNMLPQESRSIFYKVPFLLTDLSEFSDWNTAQLVSIEQASATEILVRDLQTPSIMPGERGEVALKLFNAGPVKQDVDLDILGPQGWKITPRAMTMSIDSRDSGNINFLVEAPADSMPGTYGFTLRIKYRDTFFDKQAFVYVYKPTVEIFAPPISDQLSVWANVNLPWVLLFAAIGAVFVGLTLVIYRKANEPHYDSGRLEDMLNLERMMQRNDAVKLRGENGDGSGNGRNGNRNGGGRRGL